MKRRKKTKQINSFLFLFSVFAFVQTSFFSKKFNIFLVVFTDYWIFVCFVVIDLDYLHYATWSITEATSLFIDM
jgi:hypothetical protein